MAHDLYASALKKGKASSSEELKISKLTTVALGIIAMFLGIVFEKQNVAFMVSLAFAIAASANFPALILSVLWKGCTTRGAVAGGFAGLLAALVMTMLSDAVWVATLGNPPGSAPFPYSSPAIFSMPLAFLCIWVVSICDQSPQAQKEREAFADPRKSGLRPALELSNPRRIKTTNALRPYTKAVQQCLTWGSVCLADKPPNSLPARKQIFFGRAGSTNL